MMSFIDIMRSIYGGVGVTLTVAIYGMMFAVPFALVAGVLQHFSSGIARWVVTAAIEFWRSSSVIVLLYAFYYSLPALGISLPALTVGAMVLGLNIGGYGSQSVRAALQSLSRGQREAGLALGLTSFDVLRQIELPQAIALMVPTFINQLIQLLKGTTLVSLISMTDMTFKAKQISQLGYNPVGIYSGLALAYIVLCYPITILGRRVERGYASRKAR